MRFYKYSLSILDGEVMLSLLLILSILARIQIDWDGIWLCIILLPIMILTYPATSDIITISEEGIRCDYMGNPQWNLSWDEIQGFRRSSTNKRKSVDIICKKAEYESGKYSFQLGKKAKAALEKYSGKPIL